MDLGRRPEARFPDSEVSLLDREIDDADIAFVVEHIGTFGDDNRAGIERTLHRISAIRNRNGKIVGLTCRIGRAVYGTIEIINDFVETGKSILIMGRPGIGKTTMLREAARVLADDMGKRVVVVDTSNEIAGDGDIPHPAIGKARRMQVRTPSMQHEVMIEAVENHMPQVIVIDEIGTELEAAAARTIAERGVQLIGTAHGNNLDNLMLNPTLSDLIGGIQSVTLGDEEARRRRTQKSVLERKAPPTFDVIVEIVDRERVTVHSDVAETVDAMLRGDPVAPELRWRDEEGVHRSQGRPRPSPREQLGAGALRRSRRHGLAVAHGARLARRRRRSCRDRPTGAAIRPGYRAGASGGWRQTRRLQPGVLVAWLRPGGRTTRHDPGRALSVRERRTRRSSSATSPTAARSSVARRRRPPTRGRARRASSSASGRGATRPRRPSSRSRPKRGPDRSTSTTSSCPVRTTTWIGRPSAPRKGRHGETVLVPGGSPLPTLRVLPQGISRKRLEQAIRDLDLPVVIARDVDEADVVMTLKNEYKQKTPLLREAEERAMPIYVLKSNTVPQMQTSLTSIFSLEIDPREAAMRETEDAIDVVLSSSEAVELSPQNAYIRRLQHQMAERANLVSRSRGREPFRRVRLYPDAAAGGFVALTIGGCRRVDFVGHSALVIELDGIRLLTDPATRARIGPLQRIVPVPARRDLAGIDAVLLSHLHWDHLDVPSLRDVGRSTPIFVPGGGRGLDARRRVRSRAGDRQRGRRGRRRVAHRGRAGPPLGLPPAPRTDRPGGRLRRARLQSRVLRRRYRSVRGHGQPRRPSTSPSCRCGAGARPSAAGCTWTRCARPSRCGGSGPAPRAHPLGHVLAARHGPRLPGAPGGAAGGLRGVRQRARPGRPGPAHGGRHHRRVAGLTIWQTGRP